MQNKVYRIFVINPGSTSTKLALFENERKVFSENVFHDSAELLKFETINAQLPYRMRVIRDFLAENAIDLTGIDAIVGRGGSSYPVSPIWAFSWPPNCRRSTAAASSPWTQPSWTSSATWRG